MLDKMSKISTETQNLFHLLYQILVKNIFDRKYISKKLGSISDIFVQYFHILFIFTGHKL